MEVETGLRRHLLADATIAGYVQQRVWKDRLEDQVDGSGARAIVLKRNGGWAQPQQSNTQEYPVVRVELWADHQRNDDGSVAVEDGLTGAYALARAVDRLIHGVADEWWGSSGSSPGCWIIRCRRWNEPRPGDDALLSTGKRGTADVDRLEAAVVVVDYAIQTVH